MTQDAPGNSNNPNRHSGRAAHAAALVRAAPAAAFQGVGFLGRSVVGGVGRLGPRNIAYLRTVRALESKARLYEKGVFLALRGDGGAIERLPRIVQAVDKAAEAVALRARVRDKAVLRQSREAALRAGDDSLPKFEQTAKLLSLTSREKAVFARLNRASEPLAALEYPQLRTEKAVKEWSDVVESRQLNLKKLQIILAKREGMRADSTMELAVRRLVAARSRHKEARSRREEARSRHKEERSAANEGNLEAAKREFEAAKREFRKATKELKDAAEDRHLAKLASERDDICQIWLLSKQIKVELLEIENKLDRHELLSSEDDELLILTGDVYKMHGLTLSNGVADILSRDVGVEPVGAVFSGELTSAAVSFEAANANLRDVLAGSEADDFNAAVKNVKNTLTTLALQLKSRAGKEENRAELNTLNGLIALVENEIDNVIAVIVRYEEAGILIPNGVGMITGQAIVFAEAEAEAEAWVKTEAEVKAEAEAAPPIRLAEAVKRWNEANAQLLKNVNSISATGQPSPMEKAIGVVNMRSPTEIGGGVEGQLVPAGAEGLKISRLLSESCNLRLDKAIENLTTANNHLDAVIQDANGRAWAVEEKQDVVARLEAVDRAMLDLSKLNGELLTLIRNGRIVINPELVVGNKTAMKDAGQMKLYFAYRELEDANIRLYSALLETKEHPDSNLVDAVDKAMDGFMSLAEKWTEMTHTGPTEAGGRGFFPAPPVLEPMLKRFHAAVEEAYHLKWDLATIELSEACDQAKAGLAPEARPPLLAAVRNKLKSIESLFDEASMTEWRIDQFLSGEWQAEDAERKESYIESYAGNRLGKSLKKAYVLSFSDAVSDLKDWNDARQKDSDAEIVDDAQRFAPEAVGHIQELLALNTKPEKFPIELSDELQERGVEALREAYHYLLSLAVEDLKGAGETSDPIRAGVTALLRIDSINEAWDNSFAIKYLVLNAEDLSETREVLEKLCTECTSELERFVEHVGGKFEDAVFAFGLLEKARGTLADLDRASSPDLGEDSGISASRDGLTSGSGARFFEELKAASLKLKRSNGPEVGAQKMAIWDAHRLAMLVAVLKRGYEGRLAAKGLPILEYARLDRLGIDGELIAHARKMLLEIIDKAQELKNLPEGPPESTGEGDGRVVVGLPALRVALREVETLLDLAGEPSAQYDSMQLLEEAHRAVSDSRPSDAPIDYPSVQTLMQNSTFPRDPEVELNARLDLIDLFARDPNQIGDWAATFLDTRLEDLSTKTETLGFVALIAAKHEMANRKDKKQTRAEEVAKEYLDGGLYRDEVDAEAKETVKELLAGNRLVLMDEIGSFASALPDEAVVHRGVETLAGLIDSFDKHFTNENGNLAAVDNSEGPGKMGAVPFFLDATEKPQILVVRDGPHYVSVVKRGKEICVLDSLDAKISQAGKKVQDAINTFLHPDKGVTLVQKDLQSLEGMANGCSLFGFELYRWLGGEIGSLHNGTNPTPALGGAVRSPQADTATEANEPQTLEAAVQGFAKDFLQRDDTATVSISNELRLKMFVHYEKRMKSLFDPLDGQTETADRPVVLHKVATESPVSSKAVVSRERQGNNGFFASVVAGAKGIFGPRRNATTPQPENVTYWAERLGAAEMAVEQSVDDFNQAALNADTPELLSDKFAIVVQAREKRHEILGEFKQRLVDASMALENSLIILYKAKLNPKTTVEQLNTALEDSEQKKALRREKHDEFNQVKHSGAVSRSELLENVEAQSEADFVASVLNKFKAETKVAYLVEPYKKMKENSSALRKLKLELGKKEIEKLKLENGQKVASGNNDIVATTAEDDSLRKSATELVIALENWEKVWGTYGDRERVIEDARYAKNIADPSPLHLAQLREVNKMSERFKILDWDFQNTKKVNRYTFKREVSQMIVAVNGFDADSRFSEQINVFKTMLEKRLRELERKGGKVMSLDVPTHVAVNGFDAKSPFSKQINVFKTWLEERLPGLGRKAGTLIGRESEARPKGRAHDVLDGNLIAFRDSKAASEDVVDEGALNDEFRGNQLSNASERLRRNHPAIKAMGIAKFDA